MASTTSQRPPVSRGEVWLVALDPVTGSEQSKTRPCVVVQREAANRAGRTTIVVPVTDAGTHVPSVVKPLLRRGDGGLTKDSVARCHQVRTVDRRRMRARLGSLDPALLASVEQGLRAILDL